MYTKNQKSDGTTVFSIEYAKLPFPFWSTILVAFLTWILIYNMEMAKFPTIVTNGAWVLVLLPAYIWFDIKKSRKSRIVEVTYEDITVDGQRYTRDDMQYINRVNKYSGTDVYYTNSNTANAGAAAGGIAREGFAKRSWRIEAEIGGRAVVIVDKMDDITSRGVHSDICRIMKFGKHH